MKKEKYGIQIHECRGVFDIDKVIIDPSRNRYICKPKKAIWTSTKIDEDNLGNPITEWFDWCEANDFSLASNLKLYQVVPSEDAKILMITSKSMSVYDPSGNVLMT